MGPASVTAAPVGQEGWDREEGDFATGSKNGCLSFCTHRWLPEDIDGQQQMPVLDASLLLRHAQGKDALQFASNILSISQPVSLSFGTLSPDEQSAGSQPCLMACLSQH